MLPIYTRILSPDEYGSLGLLMAVYTGVGVLFAAGFDTVIVRNYVRFATTPPRQQAFLDAIWRFLLVYPLSTAVLITALAWPFAAGSSYFGPVELALALLASAINVAATTLPLAVLRARQDLRGYAAMTIVVVTGTTGLTALFVIGFDQGVKGWFLAMALANTAVLVTAWRVMPWNRDGAFQWSVVRVALIFSIPLLPHFMSHWALQLADRGIIASMVSRADLGVYTLAANIASVAMMLVMSFNQAFAPGYARAGVNEAAKRALPRTVVIQIACVVAITTTVAVVGPPVVRLVSPPDYHGAASLVPWISLGYGFLGLYFIPMNGATLAAGRRTYAWVATVTSAAFNVALLFIFVPEHGITAAAIASTAGYLALLVFMSLWAHGGANPVRYDWPRIITICALGGVTFAASTLWTPDHDNLAAITVGLVWMALLLGAMAVYLSPHVVRSLAQKGVRRLGRAR